MLANSSWCVWTAQKQKANTLANCFINFFVSVNSNLTCERLANVLATVNQSKHELCLRVFSSHFSKWRTQVRPLLNLSLEVVYNCPAVWDVLSVVYRDTKNKQKKMDKLGFVHTFLFLRRFVFLPFSSVFSFTVLRECHYTKSAMLWITVCCDLTRVWRAKEQVCQREFANLSLQCEDCFKNTKFPRRNYQAIIPRQKHYCLLSVQWLGVVHKISTFSHNLKLISINLP